MSGLALLLVALAGLALGATSIGGIVVVPALTVADQVPVPEAIAAANPGFLLPSVAAFIACRTSPETARPCCRACWRCCGPMLPPAPRRRAGSSGPRSSSRWAWQSAAARPGRAAGWVAGWLGARRLPVAVIRRLLAASLIGVGLWYGWQTLQA